VASGGVVRISNGCTIDRGRIVKVGVPKDALAAMQSVEYVRAFLIGRIPWSELNALMIVSGAFGLFRRDAVEAVGGYERGTVGEDVELVMRLHRVNRDARRPYRIQFVAYPILWTEGPEDLRSLSRQRRRWQRGLGETLWRTRGMFLRPRYGFVGMATLPFFLVFEFLAPTVALVGVLATIVWWLLGGLSPSFMLVFAFTSFLLGGLLTMAAVTMDQLGGRQRMSNRDLAAAMGWSLVSNVGYPQFIEACQTVGYVDLARGKKTWGAQRRRGIGTTTDTD
jgi:cellulose synthase/poly-beta-1,6-N-acetylglucosamine synthase-like glycosyltransferase